MFVLWAASVNYKVYHKGTTSVCVNKLWGQGCIVKPTLQRSDVPVKVACTDKRVSSTFKKQTENQGQ